MVPTPRCSNHIPDNIRWQPPPHNTVKINFDGSVKSGSASSGFIFRDSLGQPILASTTNSGSTTIPTAEAIALRDSLIAAMDRGLQFIEVEGDSKLVIDAVNGVSHPPWKLRKIITDIRSLVASFSTITFKHVFRKANFAADSVTKLGHTSSDRIWWVNCFPPTVSRAILFDTVNCGGPRGLSI
ncbi:uncharacterized protein LOC133737369 [Rosa rugosa]|uniref:uncharacterized protein LOC133737369 n=1 Tax=Rosa rugosa TaxID=74645 RepID=UPI002B4059D1|nr:uncharacterized protein LOC133737369 [Rosa rugosa]